MPVARSKGSAMSRHRPPCSTLLLACLRQAGGDAKHPPYPIVNAWGPTDEVASPEPLNTGSTRWQSELRFCTVRPVRAIVRAGKVAMKRNPLMSRICRIANLRARSAYLTEKQRLLAELRDARQRGDDLEQFLAAREQMAITAELLGRSG
jgi:hypothetical protein